MTHKAIDLFNQIKDPSEVNIIILFNACAQLRTKEALDLAKKVSREMPKSFHSNPRLLASLLDALMKCGDVTDAELLFDKSNEKILSMYGAMMKGDTYHSDNCLIKLFSLGFIENNMANKAVDLFNKIKTPDEVINTLLFNACAQLRSAEALALAKKVSEEMPKSSYLNRYLITSLFDALVKCGDCSNAEILFSKMPKSVEGYGNLMNGFNKENNPSKILDLFNRMKFDGIEADIIIYLCVIKALSQIGDYSICKSIIKQIPESFLGDNQIQNALIDMWVGSNKF